MKKAKEMIGTTPLTVLTTANYQITEKVLNTLGSNSYRESSLYHILSIFGTDTFNSIRN